MINTIFHFVNDPTFDYQTAVNNGDISEYTIVFNSADHSIHCKGAMFGRMSRADIAETLGNISDLIPVATDSTLGGIKIGYTNDSDQNSRRYGVVLDSNNKAYVEVPWSDTITPDYDDSAVKALIATERSRIDNFISTLSSTIDAKNRELLADAQWVQEVFGVPQAEGTIWLQFENEIDHYLNEYMVWEWVDPNDHTKGRNANISSIRQDVGEIDLKVGRVKERIDDVDGGGTELETFVSSITLEAGRIDAKAGLAQESANAANLAVSNLELSVHGFYEVQVVNAPNPDNATNISTISSNLSSRGTLVTDGEWIKQNVFTTDPTQNVVYKKTSPTPAVYFKLSKIDNTVESLANLSSSLSLYDKDNDGNLNRLVKMAASVLGLKTSKNGSLLTTTADLASVIETTPNQTTGSYFTGYSGLSTKVEEAKNGMTANSSLLSHVIVKNDDGQGNVTYNVQSDIISGVINSTSFTDGVSTATATLSSTVDGHTAAIATKVSKDSNGVIESSATISADLIYLSGNTFANSIFSGFVKTDTLTAGYATIANLNAATARITDLEADNVTINNELTAAKATFTGELIGATGSFSGEVTASEFIAGDSVNGFSINIIPSAFQFNWKGTPLAWFSLCGWDETNNTFATPTTDPKGFYLYMRSPVDGHMITIDFANLTFKDLNANSNPVYTYPLYSITRLNGNVANDPVISQDRDVYYTDVNNTKTWYSNSKGTTALSSVSGYRKASIDYSQGPNNGSPMLNPYVLKQRGSTGPYDLVKADIYIGLTLSGGQVVDDTSKIVVVVMDTDGHYKICTPISGNPKSVSGASNVYYQGVLSNNFAGGHRDIGSSSTSVSAYVVDLASTTGNIYSGNSVTYFDNNNHTTSMLATTYPAA